MANDIYDGVGLSFQVYGSVARTATPNTAEFVLPQGTAYGVFVIDTTAAGVSPSTTFTVSGVDRVSGKLYTILTSAAITAVGTVVLRIGPTFTTVANVTAQDILPPVIRIAATHGNATTHTYTVSGLIT